MKSTNSREHTIKMFLKFGSEINIHDLYENGTIYLNPIQNFRSFEDAELRGDKYEGVSHIKNYPPGKFQIPALNFRGNYINIHLKKAYEVVLGNIYSLYCISSFSTPNPSDFTVDERVSRFGTHCLIVKDNGAFLSRIEKALQRKNLKYTHNFVSYYDKYALTDSITLFQKPNEFAYQNEFRIYVESNVVKPIIVKIGSLKGVAQVVPTSEIMTLKLVQNPNKTNRNNGNYSKRIN